MSLLAVSDELAWRERRAALEAWPPDRLQELRQERAELVQRLELEAAIPVTRWEPEQRSYLS